MDLQIWVACFILAVAAYIDWKDHRVPNWITFTGFAAGLVFHLLPGGSGIGFALLGALVGLLTLIVPYALNGMGAGDVKLMAAVGAWVGPAITIQAFVWIAIVGGVMGIGGVLLNGRSRERLKNMLLAGKNMFMMRELQTGAENNAPKRVLLPYGVPIAFGFFAYFLFGGLV
jgi:prepilin peptidase CpaA